MALILELGNYVVPAYAGMLLAEQGHEVIKLVNGRDPIQGLRHGDQLWSWINHGKRLVEAHPAEWLSDPDWLHGYDVVLDNFQPATLAKWGIDPAALAKRFDLVWVSMRSELPGRSFDLIAQARSILEFSPWVPFWLGDTAGGLWLAFKALAALNETQSGHHVLGQASVLQKLVEGELVIDVPRTSAAIPWETEPYHFDETTREAVVEYKGTTTREPVRDRDESGKGTMGE